MNIREIQFPKRIEALPRVAAYARVSSGKDAMLQSLSSQVSYYSSMIQSHPGWLYAGVYADEARTGTKEARPEFQRLLEDCRAGKIQLIITKSISRFARNTVTLLATVRELKALGVDVFFEEQHIHTLSADGELMITILASYAQEESFSASENQKWRIRKNFQEGKPWDATILGYRYKDGKYEIEPGEAAIVRKIYDLYLAGRGLQAITNMLNEEGAATRFGKTWHISSVRHILMNPTYTGDLLLQKTFRTDHLTKHTVKNNGELQQFLVEEAHEAIVSHEEFARAQEIREKRAAKHAPPEKRYDVRYPFSGLIVCGCCGAHYHRKVTNGGVTWICPTFNQQGKKACQSKAVPESALINLLPEIEQIENILVQKGNKLIITYRDGRSETHTWRDRSRAESWTPEMKKAARERARKQRSEKNAPHGGEKGATNAKNHSNPSDT